MIPRLKPRPSLRRPSGIENTFHIDDNNSVKTSIPPGKTNHTSVSAFSGSEFANQTLSASNDDIHFSKGDTQSLETSQDNQQLSPSRLTVEYGQQPNSPVPNDYGNQYKHMLLNHSSSSSNSFGSENSSMSCGDFSLTPPTAGSRPALLVSAKRHGSEVRRQHNKRRRRRRRPSSTRSESENRSSESGEFADSIDSDCRKAKDSDALCLWKSDSPDEAEDNYLPLLGSSDEEDEQTDRIEEVVRAEHEKLQLKNMSFSARRAPPPKGCLSNPRPKRAKGHPARYKTPPPPPKSTDDLDSLSKSAVHQSRRVQFGIPSAVLYEIDRPSGDLTPMSQEVTRKLYSMNPKDPTREEDEITHETKRNNLILSQWEDQLPKMTGNRNRSTSDRLKKGGFSSKRNRSNRRASSIFSPASRLSLAYDVSNQTDHCTKQNDDSLSSTSSDSRLAPSTKDLASLSTLRAKTSFEETCSRTPSRATPVPAVKPVDNDQTWDFVADLGSINSKGAMELSPHSSGTGKKESAQRIGMSTITNIGNSVVLEESRPSPVDVNLETISALDAAIENGSPNQCLTSLNDNPSSDSLLPCCEHIRFENSSDMISKMLITTPSSDQEWDFLSLVRYLSFVGRKENTIKNCLKWLDPCIRNALSLTNDFAEQVMHALSLESTFPDSVSKCAIMTEWKEIEISFIENLTNLLHQFRLGIEQKSLLVNNCTSNPRLGYKKVENEISEIENSIHRQKSSLDILAASMAPFSCLICQATAQIGIYGFSVQKFRDDYSLELEYTHAIFGVKTCVIVNIHSRAKILIENNVTSNRDQDSIFDFHQGYINMLKCGETSFQLDSTDLQGSLLNLGLMLGKLDQCALALKAISDEQNATIAFDLPHIRLTFPLKGTIVSLTLDLESFETKIQSVSIGGRSFKGRKCETLSIFDWCNLESLDTIVSRYNESIDLSFSQSNDQTSLAHLT